MISSDSLMEMGIRSSTTDSSSSSSSSSIDSTSITRPPPYNHHFYQQQPFNNNNNNNNTDLSTDLRLGLSLTSSSANIINEAAVGTANFFVKVYMEGIPIGRKLDLFAHHGYHELVTTLTRMFRTSILYPGIDRMHSDQDHVLTYEDKEGDLMMVGDVPWDLFLSTVKRLKITRSDNC